MLQSDSLKLPLCHGDSESQFKTMKYQPDYPDAFSQLNTLACGARTMWLGITFRTITLESRALCHRKYLPDNISKSPKQDRRPWTFPIFDILNGS